MGISRSITDCKAIKLVACPSRGGVTPWTTRHLVPVFILRLNNRPLWNSNARRSVVRARLASELKSFPDISGFSTYCRVGYNSKLQQIYESEGRRPLPYRDGNRN